MHGKSLSAAIVAGFLATGALGCSSEDGGEQPASPGDVLDLAAPANGVQLRTQGTMIAASADQEWCEVVEIPGEPGKEYFIGRTEVQMTEYSHHLIINMAAEGTTALEDAQVGAPVPCVGAQQIFGSDLVSLGGSVRPYSESSYPPGIGQVVRGGQKLVFNYHYLNTTDKAVPAKHRFNLHFIDAIEKPARQFGFYLQYLNIPPRGTASFVDECTFNSDVYVWSLLRHTHRTGTDFSVWWVGGPNDGQHLWTTKDWELDVNYSFAEPLLIPAGTGFRWECQYDNPTDNTVIFGNKATDEMCILFGSFYAAGDNAATRAQNCYRFTPTK
jgi:hypothetical protein